MLGDKNLMAFVAVADAGRARPFYEEVLGLTVRGEDPYGINFGEGGRFLRMSVIPGFKPASFSVLSWVVEDIVPVMAGLKGRGVSFEVFPGMGQDVDGVWQAPDGTLVAWFKDPDGNMLSLTEFPR